MVPRSVDAPYARPTNTLRHSMPRQCTIHTVPQQCWHDSTRSCGQYEVVRAVRDCRGSGLSGELLGLQETIMQDTWACWL